VSRTSMKSISVRNLAGPKVLGSPSNSGDMRHQHVRNAGL
jgi:hypothetical protein